MKILTIEEWNGKLEALYLPEFAIPTKLPREIRCSDSIGVAFDVLGWCRLRSKH